MSAKVERRSVPENPHYAAVRKSELDALEAENAALLKDDALLALKLAIDDTRIVAERLEAENAALLADAERYRWLRAHRHNLQMAFNYGGNEELDAAIDAAKDQR